MNPVYKLYLKEFIKAGFYFSFFYLLLDLIFEDSISYLFVGASFVFFGGLWSLVGVTAHVERIKSLGVKNLTDETLRSKQVRELLIDLGQEELLNELQKDPVFGKMSISRKDSKIKLTSGVTWDSWGVITTIKNVKETGGQNIYKVTSRPRIYVGQPDFGRSLEYIMRFENIVGNQAATLVA